MSFLKFWYVHLFSHVLKLTAIQICSSQWTVSQQQEVVELAKTMISGIKTIKIPPGLNATKGGDAVVDFLKEQVIGLGLPTRS